MKDKKKGLCSRQDNEVITYFIRGKPQTGLNMLLVHCVSIGIGVAVCTVHPYLSS